MYMDQLIYFLHVIETGSINSAAQKFYMTQQAINASMKKLEAELNTQLFMRSNKGMTLTPQGRILEEYARNIVQQYDEMQYELKQFQETDSDIYGTLSIFSASIFTNLFLPKVIRDFTSIYPKTKIKVVEIFNDDLLSYIFQNYCEVALFSASKSYISEHLQSHSHNTVQSINLMDDTMVLCMRPDHPLLRYKTIDTDSMNQYAETENFRFSLYQVQTEKMQYDQRVFEDAISISGNAELHKKLILEGVVATYMPNLAYQYEFKPEGLVSIPVVDSYSIQHCLLYRDNPNSENYKLLQTFLTFMQKRFQKQFGVYKKSSK